MAIARRNLLGIGAAVAVTAAASSCRGAGQSTNRLDIRSPMPTTPVPSVHAPPTLPGHPPPGSLYYGASVPYGRSLRAWEQELGSVLALNRSYFTPDVNEVEQLVARCRADLAHGRLPHVSMKPAGTWRDIASGERDNWLASMLRPLAAEESPVLFTLSHEPENDAGPPGMEPSDYVAMQRRLIDLAAMLAPMVIVAPILQGWTFDPRRDDLDPGLWIVPDAPVIGFDVYNPWSPTNGKEWRSFGSTLDEVTAWFGDAPVVIGEYGCRDDPENPGLAAEWLRDAANYARNHNIVSMSYFNSHMNAPEGSWELTGERESAFAELLASDWVARPA
jgi:hypothetical protein